MAQILDGKQVYLMQELEKHTNNNCKVGVIGPDLDLNYPYTKISNSLSGLNDIKEKNQNSQIFFIIQKIH